jgi:hypothetical protein
MGQLVEVWRFVSNDTESVGTDIRLPYIVTENDQDIRFFNLRIIILCGTYNLKKKT